MLKHYLTVAFRNLIKYKTQTVISIIGLAVGFASFALSGMWLRYELTYDIHQPAADRNYMAGMTSVHNNSGYVRYTSVLLAGHLKDNYPEIEDACSVGLRNMKIEVKEYQYMKVDSSFFFMFPVTLVAGSYQFLHREGEAGITESAAKRLFGSESPLGKKIKKEWSFSGQELTITAVFKEWKEHSNYNFDFLVPIEQKYAQWGYQSMNTLVRLHSGVNVEELSRKLLNISVTEKYENNGHTTEYKNNIGVILTPLTELHYTHPQNDATIHLEHIRLFCLIGLLIVLSALFNYLIMYLIRIRMRQREMALRKVNGASDSSLMLLLMSELFLLIVIALFIGGLLIELLSPAFKKLSMIEENRMFFYRESILYMGGIIMAAILFSWLTLLTQRHHTLQSSIVSASGRGFSMLFRKIGLWFQLALSIGFIFCTIVMIKQLHHLYTSRDMGFANMEIGIVKYMEGLTDRHELENGMKQIPFIEYHQLVDAPFNINGSSVRIIKRWDESEKDAESVSIQQNKLNKDIFNLFGLEMAVGAFPNEEEAGDNVLINESAAHVFGWDGEAIGKKFENYTVTGVIKDLRLSPIFPALPSLYQITNQSTNDLPPIHTFTYQGSLGETKKKIEAHFQKTYPEFSMQVTSVRQMIEDALVSERALMKLLSVASVVCVIIAIFGIFSLVSLSCEQRRKEIAIRKVNGATLRDIIGIFIKEYMVLLVFAAVIAFPIGYMIMKQWLATYIIQTTVSWWIYAGILTAVILIIFISIGWRVLQAAQRNPAEEIKTE